MESVKENEGADKKMKLSLVLRLALFLPQVSIIH